MLFAPKSKDRLLLYAPSADEGGGSSGEGNTSSGESQKSPEGEKPKTEPNSDISKTLADLQKSFDDYRTKTNRELGARRTEIKKLLEQLSGETTQEKAAGEGEQKPDSETQASLLAVTGQLQSAQAAIEQLTKQVQDLTFQLHAERGARRKGFLHEEDVFRLIDPTALKLEGDKVTGIDEALDLLMQKYPALVSKRSGETPPDMNESKGSGGGNAADREKALRSRFGI